MGLETRVHCLNEVVCQTRVPNVGSCFRLLWSFRFMPIFLLPLFYYCLVAW
jgi:hypothetical protein